VVVTLLPFVLPATIVAARRGFSGPANDERGITDGQRPAPSEGPVERSGPRTWAA
jgi:hypothetical protein